MTKVLSIDQIFNYVECPYRLTLSRKDEEIRTFAELKVILLSKLTKYYYGALGRNGKVHLRDIRTRLGLLWSDIKPRISFLLLPEHLLTIDARASKLMEYTPRTVIGIDYPMILHYKDFDVQGSVDILTYSSVNTLEGTWFDMGLSYTRESRDTAVLLKSWFFLNSLKRNAYKYASAFKIRVLRVLDGRTYYVSDQGNRQLSHMVKAIASSIGTDDNAQLPRASRATCSPCSFKESCQWSVTA